MVRAVGNRADAFARVIPMAGIVRVAIQTPKTTTKKTTTGA